MTAEALREIRTRLSAAYGPRLRGIVLYGSEARGDAQPESDVDLLVLLDGAARTWEDWQKAAEALYPLMQRIGRIIDAMPVDAGLYAQSQTPLFERARREGIAV